MSDIIDGIQEAASSVLPIPKPKKKGKGKKKGSKGEESNLLFWGAIAGVGLAAYMWSQAGKSTAGLPAASYSPSAPASSIQIEDEPAPPTRAEEPTYNHLLASYQATYY